LALVHAARLQNGSSSLAIVATGRGCRLRDYGKLRDDLDTVALSHLPGIFPSFGFKHRIKCISPP